MIPQHTSKERRQHLQQFQASLSTQPPSSPQQHLQHLQMSLSTQPPRSPHRGSRMSLQETSLVVNGIFRHRTTGVDPIVDIRQRQRTGSRIIPDERQCMSIKWKHCTEAFSMVLHTTFQETKLLMILPLSRMMPRNRSFRLIPADTRVCTDCRDCAPKRLSEDSTGVADSPTRSRNQRPFRSRRVQGSTRRTTMFRLPLDRLMCRNVLQQASPNRYPIEI